MQSQSSTPINTLFYCLSIRTLWRSSLR